MTSEPDDTDTLREQLWDLPEGMDESSFGGVDLTYEHLLARDEAQDRLWNSRATSAGFAVATSGVLLGLLTRTDPTVLHVISALLAMAAFGVGLLTRYPGRWVVMGAPEPAWETAHPVQLKRALVAAAIERSEKNRKVLERSAATLRLSFWMLGLSLLAATTQVCIDAVRASL